MTELDQLRQLAGRVLDEVERAVVGKRAALGEAGWALLTRDQRDLPDREAPGLPPAALAELVTNLERIGEEDRRHG